MESSRVCWLSASLCTVSGYVWPGRKLAPACLPAPKQTVTGTNSAPQQTNKLRIRALPRGVLIFPRTGAPTCAVRAATLLLVAACSTDILQKLAAGTDTEILYGMRDNLRLNMSQETHLYIEPFPYGH